MTTSMLVGVEDLWRYSSMIPVRREGRLFSQITRMHIHWCGQSYNVS